MKVIVNLADFQDALEKVENGINKNASLSIIKNVLLEAKNDMVELTASDFEVTIRAKIKAEVIQEGKILLGLDTLKLIKKLKGTATEITDKYITAGVRRLEFISPEPENYPVVVHNEKFEKEFELEEQELRNILKIKYATAVDRWGTAFNCFCFDGRNVITTDTHRAALRKLSIDTGLNSVCINLNAIQKLEKLISKKGNSIFKVKINDNYMTFVTDGIEIIARIVEVEYVNYKNAIPSFEKYILVNREKLKEELTLLKEILKRNKKKVYLNVVGDRLNILAENESNTMQTKIDIINNNNINILIGFNINYLLDIINHNEVENLKIFLKGELEPAVVEFENGLDLIMPMRLEEQERQRITEKFAITS